MAFDPQRRRGARIDAELAVRIAGLDDAPSLRPCNVSVSGIYTEVTGYPGTLGTVERLEIATEDGAHRVTLLAVVVRTVHVDDLFRGAHVAGVAFEFLVEDARERDALRALVRSVAGDRFTRNQDVDGLSVSARVQSSGDEGTARVSALRSEAIVLETSWPLERGASVQLIVGSTGHGAPLEVSGVVQQTVRAEDRRYRVEVRVESRAESLTPTSTRVAPMDALLTEAVAPEMASRLRGASADLSGDLERVSLASLVSFLEFERLSGTLSVEQAHGSTVLYIDEGRITDVDGASDAAMARGALSLALRERTGAFRLKLGPTSRADRFGTASSALLLDLMRTLDESSRG